MSNTQKIDFKNFSWTNIVGPARQDMDILAEKYKFHPLDLADCLTVTHRSKVDIYPGYIFIVFLFPVYNRATREISSTEINIFIGPNFLITIHQNSLKVLSDFFEMFKISPDARNEYLDRSPERLLYELLNKIIFQIFPMATHLSQDCDNIEKAIFSGQEKKMVSEILIIRRNITDFRQIMQAHKNVLKRLIINLKESPKYVMKKTDVYFESLIDYIKEIWDISETLKERIEAIQQTNESQISFKLSDIMRILTIISVITLPITLLATIFGMNTVHAMPFVNNQHGFWYVVIVMLAIAAGMLMIFKKKGWL